jgi:hypothetical protein
MIAHPAGPPHLHFVRETRGRAAGHVKIRVSHRGRRRGGETEGGGRRREGRKSGGETPAFKIRWKGKYEVPGR